MLRRLLHKIVPPENSLPLAITGLMNLIAFSGPKLLQVLGWSLPMHDMTAAFDRAFPFSPVWVFVYVAAFPFWIYQYSVVAKESRSLCYRLVAADFAAKVICLLFFAVRDSASSKTAKNREARDFMCVPPLLGVCDTHGVVCRKGLVFTQNSVCIFWKSALAASERMEDAPQTRRFVHSGHAFRSGGI